MIARSIAMKLRGRCGVRLWVLGRLRTKPSFSTHFVEAGAHRGPAAGDRAGVSAIDLRVDGVPRVRGAVQDAEDVESDPKRSRSDWVNTIIESL